MLKGRLFLFCFYMPWFNLKLKSNLVVIFCVLVERLKTLHMWKFTLAGDMLLVRFAKPRHVF